MAVWGRRWAAAGLVAGLMAAAAGAEGPDATAMAERWQVVFDPVERRVERARVRVADPHPDLGLAFLWEPAPGNWPGLDAEGRAEGPGRLSWRMPGAASYDTRAVHHVHEGIFRAGQPEGPGRRSYRSGEWLEGVWQAGRLEGLGRHMRADGALYEGSFAAGLPEGEGRLARPGGHVWEGGFRAGRKHGPGVLHRPGGAWQRAVHADGALVEAAPLTPGRVAMLAGLLPAQGGSDADRSEVAVGLDLRMTAQQEFRYTHSIGPETLLVYPAHPEVVAAWNGTAQIGPRGLPPVLMAGMEEAFPVFLDARLGSSGAPVTVAAVSLEAERSDPWLMPVLGLASHVGCIGYRPRFSLDNIGWGPVEGASARVRFVHPRTGLASAQEWQIPIGSFDEGLVVELEPMLRAAGVDVASLAVRRFGCPSWDQRAACADRLAGRIDFGALAGHVGLIYADGSAFGTRLEGTIDFAWTDAHGQRHGVRQTMAAELSLAGIEIDLVYAEGGDGMPFAAEAPDFVALSLPVQGAGYALPIPFRGNPRLTALPLRLKLEAPRNSTHRFRLAARFADGSIRMSQPVDLYFWQPRASINWEDGRFPDWDACHYDYLGGMPGDW